MRPPFGGLAPDVTIGFVPHFRSGRFFSFEKNRHCSQLYPYGRRVLPPKFLSRERNRADCLQANSLGATFPILPTKSVIKLVCVRTFLTDFAHQE